MNQIIVQNIDDFCSAHKTNRAEFERDCDLSNGMVYAWSKGKWAATLKSIEKVVKHTGIPAEYWIKGDGVNEYFSKHSV